MSCLPLLRQEAPCARCLARDNTGISIAARIAMMAMTTSSSISVKARRDIGLMVIQIGQQFKARVHQGVAIPFSSNGATRRAVTVPVNLVPDVREEPSNRA